MDSVELGVKLVLVKQRANHDRKSVLNDDFVFDDLGVLLDNCAEQLQNLFEKLIEVYTVHDVLADRTIH